MTSNIPARSQATDPAVLADLANKINVCLGKADDYRVTAAQHLAEAKKACQTAGISFKDWAAREIKYSYTEAVKLAKIGASDDPAKALADMRKNNAGRNKAHRAKVVSRDTTPPAKKQRPEEAALAAIDKLKPDSRRNLIRSLAANGLAEDRRAMVAMILGDATAAFEAVLAKADNGARIRVIVGLMRKFGINVVDLRDGASVPGDCIDATIKRAGGDA